MYFYVSIISLTPKCFLKNSYFLYGAEWLHQGIRLQLHTSSHHQHQTLGRAEKIQVAIGTQENLHQKNVIPLKSI